MDEHAGRKRVQQEICDVQRLERFQPDSRQWEGRRTKLVNKCSITNKSVKEKATIHFFSFGILKSGPQVVRSIQLLSFQTMYEHEEKKCHRDLGRAKQIPIKEMFKIKKLG